MEYDNMAEMKRILIKITAKLHGDRACTLSGRRRRARAPARYRSRSVRLNVVVVVVVQN